MLKAPHRNQKKRMALYSGNKTETHKAILRPVHCIYYTEIRL